MALTEREIARGGLRGTASVTFASACLAFALASGAIIPGLTLGEKPTVLRTTEISDSTPYATKIVTWVDQENRFQARSTLGKRLATFRNRAIEKGMPLLDADAIELEMSLRRGEAVGV